MTDRPILFSTPMVRALLDGRKTQTRRILSETKATLATKIAPGDRLWVREAWRVSNKWDATKPRDLPARTMTVFFETGGSIANQEAMRGWEPSAWPGPQHRPDWVGRLRPGMFLPRWASRMTLTVTDVKIERLQAIRDADALAEGVEHESADPPFYYVPGIWPHSITAVGIEEPGGRHASRSYAKLWNHINGPGSWDANPWVAAYTFDVHHQNIEAAQ